MNSTVEEVPELQAIHDACSYLSNWDGESVHGNPDYLKGLVNKLPLPPQAGERTAVATAIQLWSGEYTHGCGRSTGIGQ